MKLAALEPERKAVNDAARPALRPPVAVLVSRFPLVTETFILREIEELERQGQGVVLVPLLREYPKVIHAASRSWHSRALYTPWLCREGLAALARRLRRTPTTVIAAIGLALAETVRRPATFAKTVALLPKALHLAELLERRGVDHLHAHFATHPTAVAWLLSRLTGIPYSFTAHAHDIFVEQTMLRRKIRDASFVRAISEFNRRVLEAVAPEAETPIHVIRVGVEVERYSVAGARYGSSSAENDTAEILCIAAMKPYKGLEVLLQALALLPRSDSERRWRCRIIGDGPLRSRIERTVHRLDLTSRVELCGLRTEDEVVELLQQSSLLVQPSIVASDGQMEGIPVALMEALASSVPIVASALSGIPELVEDEVGGLLVEPGNPSQLAHAIDRLLANPALGQRLAERGRQRVRSEFTLERSVASLAQTLDDHRHPARNGGVQVDTAALPVPVEGGVVDWMVAGPDSRVLAVRFPQEQRLVLKEHLSRPGESRPACERARREHELLVRLCRKEDRRVVVFGHQCRVPQPVGHRGACLAMEAVSGQRLDDLIRAQRWRQGTALVTAIGGAGAWLRWFQGALKAEEAPSTDRATREAARALAKSGPSLDPRRRRRLMEELDRLEPVANAETLSTVVVHGDFWPGNLLVSADHIVAVDFEGYRYGCVFDDGLAFLSHLGLFFSSKLLARRLRILASAFVEQWCPGAEPPWLAAPATWRLCEIAVALDLGSRGHRTRSERAFLTAVVDGRWRWQP